MASLKDFLLALGIPGVAVIAAIDSAGVPMPGGPDAVVMLVSWQRPPLMVFVALAAALGSAIGCYVLYLLGKKGGDVALSRFDKEKQDRVKAWLRRNDFLAIFVSVIGPPPFPTKLFVLGAGAINMSVKRFLLAVFTGRFLRYLVEGYLGARFGDQAAEMIKSHYPEIGITLLAAAAVVIIINRFRSREGTHPA